MAEDLLIFTCPQPDCGKQFKMRHPGKGGVYKVTCPACKKAMQVRFPDPNPAAGTAASDTAGEATPPPLDNSTARPIELKDEYNPCKTYAIECPHCGLKGIKYVPAKAGKQLLECPKCHGKMSLVVTSPTEIVGGVQVDAPPMEFNSGRLVLLHRGLRKNEFFPLRNGEQLIGRRSAEAPSDVSLDDPTVSRQSVVLDVSFSENGYKFCVTVRKATNPVLLNGKEIRPGFGEYLNFGDILTLGKSRLRLEKD